TNAQTGRSIKADVMYTYKIGSFEQDVVFHQQPPGPDLYGMNSERARIQLLTEFMEAPSPVVAAGFFPTQVGPLEDDQVSFGAMSLGAGKAFMLGTNSPSAIINKRWLQTGGRQLLL